MDLNTGFHKAWSGANQNDLDRVKSFNNGMSNSGKGEKGEELSRFLDFKTQTNARTTFTLNTASMSIEEVNMALDEIVAAGEELEYVEIGNELYFNQYASIIPDVDTYIEKAKRLANAVRTRFPNAKIGAQVPSQIYTSESFLPDAEETDLNRTEKWYSTIKNEDFYDAIIIHLYSSIGMNHLVSSEDFIPFKEAYRHCISHADNKLEGVLSTLRADFPDVEIWATEFHVGGFSGDVRQYRLRHSYLGGLYASNFMFKLFSDPNVSLSNWHSMVQWQGGSGESFGTLVNHHFFNLFNNPANESNQFVPVDLANSLNYSGAGDHTGEFKDVEGGVFLNDEMGKGYLMIFNKWENSYMIGVDELENKLMGTISKCSQITTDSNLTLKDRLESEDQLSHSEINPSGKNYFLKPFSVSVFEFTTEGIVLSTKELSGNYEPIHPNPSNGTINIHVDKKNFHSWILYDQSGKKVKVGPIQDSKTELNLGEYQGFYFLRLIGRDGKTVIYKVILE